MKPRGPRPASRSDPPRTMAAATIEAQSRPSPRRGSTSTGSRRGVRGASSDTRGQNRTTDAIMPSSDQRKRASQLLPLCGAPGPTACCSQSTMRRAASLEYRMVL